MGVAERYRDLISATQRYASGLGVKLNLEAIPDDRQFPIVFVDNTTSALTAADDNGRLVFLFVPGETLLTSDVLADVIRRIMQAPAGSRRHVLLFAEDDLRVLRRTLDATGLGLYSAVHSYTYRTGQYECNWTDTCYSESETETETGRVRCV
jgi:hypothetical protein